MKLIPGLQLAIDSAVLIAVGLVTYHALVFHSYRTVELYYAAISFNWLINILLFQFAGLYTFSSLFAPRTVVDRLAIAITITFIMMLAAGFSLKISDQFSRVWLGAFYASSVIGTIAARFAVGSFTSVLAERRLIVRRVALYGHPQQISLIHNYFSGQAQHVAQVAGVFVDADLRDSGPASQWPSSRGGMDELIEFIRKEDVDDVILALPWSEPAKIKATVERLRELPTNVLLGNDLAGFSVLMTTAPSYFDGSKFSQLAGKPLSGWDVVAKSIMDYAIAIIVLALLSPLLAVVAILIKLDSPGPVLFKQRRLGFNNREFHIYKFRSMREEAGHASKTVQAKEGDARVTTLGRFLRRSSIDELPQLLNVLLGHMSIVGPRPHAVDHNEEYGARIRGYFSRHRIKPGITGLAQVKGYRGPTDTDDKMAKRVDFDIQYIENWSLLLDVKILFWTVIAITFPKNAV